MAIRKEAEETKLRNTAEGDLFRSNTLEPVFGYEMVNVPIRRERDPDIDIRQVDHRNQSHWGLMSQDVSMESAAGSRALSLERRQVPRPVPAQAPAR